MRETDIEISLVIPIYNEATNLHELYSRSSKALDEITSKFEIIGIDDGSVDGTLKLLEELNRKDSRFKYISFNRNFGQQAAQRAGFEHASGKFIATIDADLQNPPEELKKLYDKIITTDYDVVAGWRKERNDGFVRTFGSKFVNRLMQRLLGLNIKDTGCNLRIYRSNVVQQLNKCREKFLFASGLIAWMGFSILEVEVSHDKRKAGTSRYSLLALVNVNIDLITGFSTVPLRIASICGILFSIVGLALGLYLIIWRLIFGAGPHGMVTLLFFGFTFFGFQMFTMGLLGEYIGRLYTEILGRPHYIVKKSSLENAIE